MEDFSKWLCEKKNYTERSARDVSSRLKRVRVLLNVEKVNTNTIDELEKVDGFKGLSMSVRSQLRKSVRLYLEYCDNK